MDIRKELSLGKNIYELPLLVCYYARVSTDHEEQATSIVNQVDYFQKYIENFSNWKLVGGYVDEGISGKEVYHRENFIRMMKDGERKRFNLVLTKSVSRFARNTIDSIWYTNHLLELGIGVFFLNDNINTFYPDSEFRLTLMASIAQDELRKLSESVRFGLQQSIKRGVVLGNDNFLGYRKDKGKLVIVEEEAKIVREIFRLLVCGEYSYIEISKRINLKYHKKFDSTRIRRILTNYKYKGYYCGRKSEVIDYKKSKRRVFEKKDWIIYKDYDRIPPIVEEGIWDRVQEIIERRKRRREQGKISFLYDEKIFCMVHKRKFIHKRKKYRDKCYHYYVCSGCCSISKMLLDRIEKINSVREIYVVPGETIQLWVKCQ